MKTIQLNRMELRNFKGVVSADYDFTEHTDIQGGNASGKSTIYEAYLWCLFDKNPAGNATKVQPLDEHNEVKHKLMTSVKLYMTIDNNPFIVERTLQEKWVKPQGTAELVLQGTTSEFAINEVPMSKTQFTAKLADVLPLDKWFMISSIAIIPAMDQKACRAALQGIAPELDEKALAANYPAVLEAMQKGITVDEFAAGVKKCKQIAKAELDTIPAAIDAQDRLRVDEDFTVIGARLDEVTREMTRISKEIDEAKNGAASSEYVEKVNHYKAELAQTMQKIHEHEQKAQKELDERMSEIRTKLSGARIEIDEANRRINAERAAGQRIDNDTNRYRQRIAELRTMWQAENAKEYAEPAIASVCPTCGQPLPAERIESARAKAREEWNTAKQAKLKSIQTDAESIKTRLDELQKENSESIARLDQYIYEVQEKQTKLQEIEVEMNAVPTVEELLKLDDEYNMARSIKQTIELGLEEMKEAYGQSSNDELLARLKEKLQAAITERDELNRRYAGKDTNARIEAERKRLEERQSELANYIAQYEGDEAQIAAFRKARITAVEDGVSSLFGMVRWKMYEANVTNDGEKEICQAIIAGVPYEQQNHATQINAGIDICNGFMRAYEVSVPLFIDNAESVTYTTPTYGQSIKLTVVAGSALQIK